MNYEEYLFCDDRFKCKKHKKDDNLKLFFHDFVWVTLSDDKKKEKNLLKEFIMTMEHIMDTIDDNPVSAFYILFNVVEYNKLKKKYKNCHTAYEDAIGSGEDYVVVEVCFNTHDHEIFDIDASMYSPEKNHKNYFSEETRNPFLKEPKKIIKKIVKNDAIEI